jgi:Heterokaryon incompatibility protein (HET)
MSKNQSKFEANIPFSYDKTPLTSRTIRLLKFESRLKTSHASEQAPHLTLFTAVLPGAYSTPTPTCTESPVRYLTLSYVWGENEYDRNPEILINKRPFKVWPNLYKALVHLKSEIELPIWIDAICINQHDFTERTDQVKQMTQIYQNATRTIIWLGEGDKSTGQLMTHLDKIGGDAIEAGLNILTAKDFERWPKFESDEWDDLFRKRKVKIKDDLEALFPKMTEGYDGRVPFPFQSLIDMSNDNPWFRRVWVIQELSVSTDYTFMYGKWSVPGDHFVAAFQFNFLWVKHEIVLSLSSVTQGGSLLSLPSEFMSVWWRNGRHNGWAFMKMFWGAARNKPSALNARAVATLETRQKWRRDRPEDRPTLKTQLIQAFVQKTADSLHATDPRDRIYGLLGVASDATELGMDPKLYPDYKETNTEEIVYTEVARKLVQHGHLDILTICRSRDPGTRNARLPSWVPDWKNAIPCPYGGFIEDDLYHASGKSSSRFISCNEALEGILTIKAMFVGKLAELGATWKGGWREDFDEKQANVLFTEVISFLQKSTIFNKPGEADKVSWRIPVGDIEWNEIGVNRRATEKSFRECQNMMKYVRYRLSSKAYMQDVLAQKQKVFEMPSIMSYMGSMLDMHDVKPFLSEDAFGGFVGLCPSEAQPGDEIFIPLGSHVPLVFRKDVDGFYLVIGDAYVQGLMDGEALELNLQVQDVRLK